MSNGTPIRRPHQILLLIFSVVSIAHAVAAFHKLVYFFPVVLVDSVFAATSILLGWKTERSLPALPIVSVAINVGHILLSTIVLPVFFNADWSVGLFLGLSFFLAGSSGLMAAWSKFRYKILCTTVAVVDVLVLIERIHGVPAFSRIALAGFFSFALISVYTLVQLVAERSDALVVAAERNRLNEQLAIASAKVMHERHRQSLALVAAGIAHEVNNPITYVQGNLELLREQSDRPLNENLELLESISGGVRTIAEVVERIRLLYKPGNSAPVSVDVYDVVSSCFSILASTIGPNTELRNNVPPGSLVVAHSAEIYVVLMNLLRNGLESIGRKQKMSAPSEYSGLAVVDSEQHEGTMELTVSDNGIGMDGEEIERAFDPFYTTKEDTNGMGIGLTLCRTIAERNDGTIVITSVQGEGATISFRIPQSRREQCQ